MNRAGWAFMVVLASADCTSNPRIIEPVAPQATRPLPARSPSVAIPRCSNERETYLISKRRMTAEDEKRRALPAPERNTRSVGLVNALGDDFVLEALSVEVDGSVAFVGLDGAAPPTVSTLDRTPRSHSILVHALVRRNLHGGFFDYVADCRELVRSWTIAGVPPATPLSRSGSAAHTAPPRDPAPVVIILERGPSPSVRIEGPVRYDDIDEDGEGLDHGLRF